VSTDVDPDPFITGGAIRASAPPLQLVDPPLPRAEDPYLVYLGGLSSGESQRAMRRCLDRGAAHILAGTAHARQSAAHSPELITGENRAWWDLRYAHLAALRNTLIAADTQPAAANQMLSAVRQVLKASWRLGYMSGEDYQRARAVANIKGTRLPAGRSIHNDEILALLRVCSADERVLAIRDQALIVLLYSTGMRRAEAAAARVEKYDPRERAWSVVGKGNKERNVYLHQVAAAAVDRWLVTISARRGPAFRPVDRWGHVRATALSVSAVNLIVERRRAEAGLPRLSPHDFRRTFAGDFLDQGGDLAALQRAMGHANQTTTALYDRRPDQQIRDVVDRLPLRATAGHQGQPFNV
jgi:site-specific recombinase XerD